MNVENLLKVFNDNKIKPMKLTRALLFSKIGEFSGRCDIKTPTNILNTTDGDISSSDEPSSFSSQNDEDEEKEDEKEEEADAIGKRKIKSAVLTNPKKKI